MLEKINSFGEVMLSFIKGLPLTDLLVGVIVPITAAWISYYLAERAMRKKENNRLYIQIELIKKEIQINDRKLNDYIFYIEEMEKIEKSLEFPLIFMKNFLVDMLDYLQEIKQNYMHSGNFLFEKPTQTYILAEELEDLEKQIEELECKYYADEFLDEKRKERLSRLIEQKEQQNKKFKELKDRDIYKEFENLQSRLERMMIDGVFEKLDEEESNFILAKYIYGRIKTFNEQTDKTKEDILSLYRDLVIFEIDSDIIKDGCFDQEKFDLYYRAYEDPEGIHKKLYDLCERYYKWLALKEKIKSYCFDFENKRWNENCSDFVSINDRELYISLVEIYEEIGEYSGFDNSYEENYKCFVVWHNKIHNIVNKMNQHELKLEKKCR